MSDRTVELRALGFWNDDVGSAFDRASAHTVRQFNHASQSIWARIEKLSQYSQDDVQYERQRDKLLQMRVEYHG